MKTFLSAILTLTLINNMHSQVGSLQWQHPRGGSQYDYTREIDQTSDGGSVAAGYSESSDGDITMAHGNGDCLLIRSGSDGSMLWQKNYGGSGFDFGYSVRQTNDGGIIYAGFTESTDGDVNFNHGGGDCWILKLNSNGVIQWEKTYGGSGNENAQCIRQTADGGFIFCGYTESSDGDVTGYKGAGDCWVVRIDAFGNLDWQKTFGGSNYDYAQDIKQTADGGFILTGGTNSSDGDVTVQKGNGDSWLVKLDPNGNLLWEKSFGGSDYDFTQVVEAGIGGGYILTGYTQSTDGDVVGQHGNGDCWVVKCDANGTLEWQRSLGSSGSDYGFGINVMMGAYVLTGYAETNDGDVIGNKGNYDCWIVLLGETGDLTGQRCFGGSGVDIGYSVREANPGCFLVAGYTESGDGDVSGYHAAGDSWIIKVDLASVGTPDDQLVTETVNAYPNPGEGLFNFTGLGEGEILMIYDITGKLIRSEKMDMDKMSIDMRDCAKGIYHYTTAGGEEIKRGRLILQ